MRPFGGGEKKLLVELIKQRSPLSPAGLLNWSEYNDTHKKKNHLFQLFSSMEVLPELFFFLVFLFYLFIFKLYKIVLVLPNIKMNPPQVYMCSPSWTLLPPRSPYHPSGSSQCTSPKHPVSCIEPGLATPQRDSAGLLLQKIPFLVASSAPDPWPGNSQYWRQSVLGVHWKDWC